MLESATIATIFLVITWTLFLSYVFMIIVAINRDNDSRREDTYYIKREGEYVHPDKLWQAEIPDEPLFDPRDDFY